VYTTPDYGITYSYFCINVGIFTATVNSVHIQHYFAVHSVASQFVYSVFSKVYGNFSALLILATFYLKGCRSRMLSFFEENEHGPNFHNPQGTFLC